MKMNKIKKNLKKILWFFRIIVAFRSELNFKQRISLIRSIRDAQKGRFVEQ